VSETEDVLDGLFSLVSAERRADISRRVHDLDHPHPKFFGSIKHKIGADHETANVRGEILSCFSEEGFPGKHFKHVDNPVGRSVRRVRAVVLNGDMAPDGSKVVANTACECEAAHGLFLSAS
jgi:hypothetical protein